MKSNHCNGCRTIRCILDNTNGECICTLCIVKSMCQNGCEKYMMRGLFLKKLKHERRLKIDKSI